MKPAKAGPVRREAKAQFDRPRIEEAILHAKQQWELTFDAVMDPMALIDGRHRVVRVNKALAERLGLSPKDCLGKLCHELIHGEPAPLPDCPHAASFEDGSTHFRFERYEPRLGGYFITTVTPFHRPGTGERWSVHVFHDISHRKEMEEVLRVREGRFRAITENTEDLTTIVTGQGFRYVSPAVRQLLGMGPEDLLGRPPENVIHPDDRIAHQRFFERALQYPGKSFSLLETRFRHADGHWVPMEAKATSMPDTPGVEGIVAVYRDITEKKQIAFQLQQSSKVESIGRLAGGLAHEFNNILGIIIGNAELALDDLPAGSSGRAFLEEILSAGLRARDVIRQLLRFSRRTPAERKPVSIATLITETLRLMRASIPSHIEIKSKIPVPHETVSADPTQIRQVLVHLCSNAFQAMERKGGRLEISVENVDLDEAVVRTRFPELKPGRYVELTIRDDGDGMEPEILDHIFDPYFSSRSIGKGAGMGLALVQGIVRSHDGAITVESQAGSGSRFRVYLPVVQDRETRSSPGVAVTPTGRERVILVDDEEALLRTVRMTLERLGYSVEAFLDSAQALAAFKMDPTRYDLLVTDMTMPGMDGSTLASAMRAARSDLPVIICSGRIEPFSAPKADPSAGIRTLPKPIEIRSLAVAVREMLNGKHSS
ncbi:MAG: PAS domain-containing hybrid sensor histidine kinase/response regulator [Desulfobacterales bacterium]